MLRNGLEPWHLLVVVILFLLLFGSKKLPDAARGLGKSMRILKSEAKAMKEDGATHSTAAPAEGAAPAESTQHVIQSAPGETATAHRTAEGTPAH
ncbi:Sec-independent protein translocase subunit TatA [Streptomyces griseorubiginosus]|uniref:Sec-independent protein translocase protein TatA n=1 Tax=Streptomyces griseorubiginosus TaxID=67304 RepID=A0AAI8L8D4_9ACTN|nr:Sec-independent protein translocase subunit TatA [Streptomyces griseorubiginosus]AYC43411.1 Sec-independent protein translocase protein TatA [Streptomyces griseorubiginosus]